MPALRTEITRFKRKEKRLPQGSVLVRYGTENNNFTLSGWVLWNPPFPFAVIRLKLAAPSRFALHESGPF
jgi:hypothetical protein